MTQIFHPRFTLWVQLGALAVAVFAFGCVAIWRAAIARPNGVNEPVEQVVPFSHKHHVGQDGIDCRYCHASVETAAFAGIPPISTCMTCHSQLYTDQKMLQPVVDSWRSGVALHWKRVHNLPDFVFFNHSIHISKGVGCATCHGRVDRMPLTMRTASLTMKWCLDCHRDPQQYLRPRDKVFDMDWKASDQLALGKQLVRDYHIDTRRLTDCSVCHR
ncbi:MAG TPA: cytochrome c3 family protein [Rhodanobacteraceae bacterium]|nr:cytochrome c3 family protein [Rhodanobacteraceae bacterium]